MREISNSAILYLEKAFDRRGGAYVEQSEIARAVRTVSRAYGIKSAWLFGSYATGTATPGSDVDLLVEFKTPVVSLLTLSGVKLDLEDILGASADVIHAPISPDALIQPERVVSLYES